MASSSSTRNASWFVLLLSICVCLQHVVSRRLSVCGAGIYTLNQTGLDIYLLPDARVILKPVPQGSSRIRWYPIMGKKKLIRSKGDNLEIGPMNKELNLYSVRYSYRQGQGVSADISNTARLYLTEPGFSTYTDKGYRDHQVVHVTKGTPQRVFCFRLTPTSNDSVTYAAPVHLKLYRQVKHGMIMTFRLVSSNRYYNNDSCLWMDSLRQENSGKYRLQISSCFPSQSPSQIHFTLSVSPSTAVPSQSTYSNSAIQSTAATNIRLVSTTSSIPEILHLTLSYGGGHVKSGILAIFVSINATLRISYNATGRYTPEVTVLLDGEKADRVAVRNGKLTLEKVQESDSGLYEVIAKEGGKRVTSKFTLIVQNETFITSSYSTIPTDTSGPNLRSNITGARNVNYSVTRYPTRTMTIPTNVTSLDTRTSLSEDGTRAAVADAPQGWVLGIIVLFIVLAIAIPTVYLSYRRRHSLRLFCSTCCHSFKREPQPSNPVYWNATYATVVKSTVSPNSERGEITTSTFQVTDDTAVNHPTTYSNVQGIATGGTSNELPDIIAAVTTQTNAATEITIEENTEISTVDLVDATNKDHCTGPTPIYAIVNKEKKPAQDTSHTLKVEETKSPQTSATSAKEELRSAEFLPVYAKGGLKKKDTKRNHDRDLPNNIIVKERTSTQRHSNDGRETPQRPARYEGSKSICLSKAEEERNTDPANEAAGNDKADDGTLSIVYAELSTPTPSGEHKSSDAFTATQQHTIQYVELDTAALTKRT